MTGMLAHHGESAGTMIRHLDKLVTYGPRDLEIASAMSVMGFDAVKWAEGQGMLAELVTCDMLPHTTLAAASAWYNEAVTAAQRALDSQPQLLAKLGLDGAGHG